jgi:tetratricopeptide (TPR) repeat protein
MLKAVPRRVRIALLALFTLSVCSEWSFSAQSSVERAQDMLSNGSPEEGVALLRQIVKTDPGNVQAHLILGTALAVKGLRNESVEHITTAIKLVPSSADAYNRLGTVLSRFLETDAARNAFEEALALDPKLAAAHVSLALILARADELSAAHEHLDRAIELEAGNKDAASAYFVRAMVWSAQGDNRSAIVDLKNATQLRPDYAAAWSDLSQLLFSASDLSGALAAAERAVAIDPKDPAAQYQLGRIYLASGNSAAALEHLKAARSLGAEDKSTMYALSRALRSTGHLEEAEGVNRKVIELERQSVNATQVSLTAAGLNDEGLRLENSGDVQAAMAKYKAALDLDPTGYGFRLNYGLALCRLGRWQEGIVQLREVLKADPNNADAAKALYIAQEKVAIMTQSSASPRTP